VSGEGLTIVRYRGQAAKHPLQISLLRVDAIWNGFWVALPKIDTTAFEKCRVTPFFRMKKSN
jgi:hypothetical protein